MIGLPQPLAGALCLPVHSPHYRREKPSLQNRLSLPCGMSCSPAVSQLFLLPQAHLRTHARSCFHPHAARLFPGVLRFISNDWKLLVTASPLYAKTLALCLVYSVGKV